MSFLAVLFALLLEQLEDIPEPGVSVKIAGYPMEIVQVQDKMVKVIRFAKDSAKTI